MSVLGNPARSAPFLLCLIEVPEELRRCDEHGDKSGIGYDESEVLHFRPASFYVELIHREKLACRPCGDGVVVASAANKIVDGGMAGPGLIADLLIGKFRDHLPLSRQIRRYARLGVKLPSSTVGGLGRLSTTAWRYVRVPSSRRMMVTSTCHHSLGTEARSPTFGFAG